MNGNKYVYLQIWHDRHTDDRFIVYEKKQDAVNRCKEIVSNFYDPTHYTFEEKDYGTEYHAEASEDYFVSVEKVELVK